MKDQIAISVIDKLKLANLCNFQTWNIIRSAPLKFRKWKNNTVLNRNHVLIHYLKDVLCSWLWGSVLYISRHFQLLRLYKTMFVRFAVPKSAYFKYENSKLKWLILKGQKQEIGEIKILVIMQSVALPIAKSFLKHHTCWKLFLSRYLRTKKVCHLFGEHKPLRIDRHKENNLIFMTNPKHKIRLSNIW